MIGKCYDFFGCKKTECMMFKGNVEKNCWELEPSLTPCIDSAAKPVEMEDKIVFCRNCLYYEYANKNTE